MDDPLAFSVQMGRIGRGVEEGCVWWIDMGKQMKHRQLGIAERLQISAACFILIINHKAGKQILCKTWNSDTFVFLKSYEPEIVSRWNCEDRDLYFLTSNNKTIMSWELQQTQAKEQSSKIGLTVSGGRTFYHCHCWDQKATSGRGRAFQCL